MNRLPSWIPEGAEEVFRVVGKLAEEGMTIVMAEQKLEKLAANADRIVLMHEGKLIEDGKPEKVFSKEDLHEFGVEPPVYVKIARALGWRNAVSGLYPISLEDMPMKRDIQFRAEDKDGGMDRNTAELLVRDLISAT